MLIGVAGVRAQIMTESKIERKARHFLGINVEVEYLQKLIYPEHPYIHKFVSFSIHFHHTDVDSGHLNASQRTKQIQ